MLIASQLPDLKCVKNIELISLTAAYWNQGKITYLLLHNSICLSGSLASFSHINTVSIHFLPNLYLLGQPMLNLYILILYFVYLTLPIACKIQSLNKHRRKIKRATATDNVVVYTSPLIHWFRLELICTLFLMFLRNI